jgi:hypothetical protein
MSVTISGDGTITVSDGSNTTTIDTTTVKLKTLNTHQLLLIILLYHRMVMQL